MGKLSLEVLSNFPPISQSVEGARTGTWSIDCTLNHHIFNQIHQRCVTAWTVYLAERPSTGWGKTQEDQPVAALSYSCVPSSNSAMAQVCISYSVEHTSKHSNQVTVHTHTHQQCQQKISLHLISATFFRRQLKLSVVIHEHLINPLSQHLIKVGLSPLNSLLCIKCGKPRVARFCKYKTGHPLKLEFWIKDE